MKLVDKVGYVIVDKETDEVLGYDIYNNLIEAKTYYYHKAKYFDSLLRKWVTVKFDDQDKYIIKKVKLVEIDE